MAAGALVDIRLDLGDLTQLADDLRFLDGRTLSEMSARTVNLVSLTVNRKSVEEVTKDLNLTRDYVESRIERDEAKGGATRAVLRSEVRGTTMQRFGAGMTQRMTPVRWSNQRIQSMGKEFSEWPGWTQRTGDRFAGRNIPANMKAAGLMAAVKPGAPRLFPHAFWMPLNRGREKGGNGFGMFTRNKAGEMRHVYGPSVYQVFRRYVQTNEQAIQDTLRDEFNALLDQKISEFRR